MKLIARTLLASAVLAVVPLGAHASVITLDNTASFSGELVGTATEKIEDFTVGNDPTKPNRYLVVGFGGEQPAQPTSVTYGGTPLTPLVSTATSVSHASLWGLADPTPGTFDISVKGAGSNGARFGVLSLKSYAPIILQDTQSTTASGGIPADLVYDPLPLRGLFIEVVERNNSIGSLDAVTGTPFFGPFGGSGGYGVVGVYGDISGNPMTHSYDFSDRHAIVGVAFGAVPEPTTFVVWSLLAGLGLGLAAKRRRKATS